MNTETRSTYQPTPAQLPGAGTPDATADLREALQVILDDMFLSIGQGVGLRASFEYDAVVWVRSHFGAKFLRAMQQFGNRWEEDRVRVTAVSSMFGERAVRHAAGKATIGLEEVRKAAADIERYCQLHAVRSGARGRVPATDAATGMIAGYWCTWDPKE
ncbi:MAG: hypothetical protein AB7O28_22640 [Vicinamibacterales bacterium]